MKPIIMPIVVIEKNLVQVPLDEFKKYINDAYDSGYQDCLSRGGITVTPYYTSPTIKADDWKYNPTIATAEVSNGK